jgi:hypothetical protein
MSSTCDSSCEYKLPCFSWPLSVDQRMISTECSEFVQGVVFLDDHFWWLKLGIDKIVWESESWPATCGNLLRLRPSRDTGDGRSLNKGRALRDLEGSQFMWSTIASLGMQSDDHAQRFRPYKSGPRVRKARGGARGQVMLACGGR